MLVEGPDGSKHLLWGDHRLRIGGHGAMQALGYSGTVPAPVSAAFLDSLPAGADLLAPEIDGRGTATGKVAGATARVGQVFALSSPGTAKQYFLLEKAGLRPLTPLAAALVLGDDRTAGQAYRGRAPEPLALTADELTRRQAGTGKTATDPADWPGSAPSVRTVATGSALCSQIQPEGTAPGCVSPWCTRAEASRSRPRGPRSRGPACRWTGSRSAREAAPWCRRSAPAAGCAAPRRTWSPTSV